MPGPKVCTFTHTVNDNSINNPGHIIWSCCCLSARRGIKVFQVKSAPQERGGLEILELRCVKTHISRMHHVLVYKLSQIHESVLRAIPDHQGCLVYRGCPGRTEPLDRR